MLSVASLKHTSLSRVPPLPLHLTKMTSFYTVTLGMKSSIPPFGEKIHKHSTCNITSIKLHLSDLVDLAGAQRKSHVKIWGCERTHSKETEKSVWCKVWEERLAIITCLVVQELSNSFVTSVCSKSSSFCLLEYIDDLQHM